MSIRPTLDPVCSESASEPVIATVIDARPRDLGGFAVGRVLPAIAQRTVGPFTLRPHGERRSSGTIVAMRAA
jgi:hypothetical protein